MKKAKKTALFWAIWCYSFATVDAIMMILGSFPWLWGVASVLMYWLFYQWAFRYINLDELDKRIKAHEKKFGILVESC